MMYTRSCPLVVSAVLVAVFASEMPAVAQQRAPTQSPEVAADGRVTFRLRAAKAAEVVVAGQWGGEPSPMTQGEGDAWSVTVGPIAPGVWEYSFRVDGLQMIDPGNPASTNEKLKLLWIACGKDDFLLKRNEDFVSVLNEKGIRHEWRLTEGNHSWPIWRGYLGELAPKLFQ